MAKPVIDVTKNSTKWPALFHKNEDADDDGGGLMAM